MPATTIAKHNNRTMHFAEANHTYIDDRGHRYGSVSSIVKSCFPQFDADATAARMEAEGKGAAADLKTAWAEKGKSACRYGTRCHETAEAILLGRVPPHKPESDREKESFSAIWKYCKANLLDKAKMEIIGVEKLVFSPRHYVAGTVDLIVKRGSEIHILDWKTNEQIKTEGYAGATAFGALAHLDDCNASKYALQLNLYETIMRDEGYIEPDAIVRKGLLWVHAGEIKYLAMPDLSLESTCALNGEILQGYKGPTSGQFREPVYSGSLRKVNAIRDAAKAIGWTDSTLLSNAGRYRYPLGSGYGLVCALAPGDEIGPISATHISIIRRMQDRTHTLSFSNSDTFPPRMGAEQCERYEERAAIQEHDGGLYGAQAETEAAEAAEKAL